jgi:ferrous iron transport protein B
VGNFPASRWIRSPVRNTLQKNCTVVDLPGIYSMRPYSQEEVVTRDFICDEKPDGIINIVDATTLSAIFISRCSS